MTDSPIYQRLADEHLTDVPRDPALAAIPDGQVRYGGATDWAWPVLEPVAASAGEQDHADPWAYAGDDADAPGPA